MTRLLYLTVLAIVLFLHPSYAVEEDGESVPQKHEMELQLARGLFCDTVEQIIRFIELTEEKGGYAAVSQVNTEVGGKSKACGTAEVLFNKNSIKWLPSFETKQGKYRIARLVLHKAKQNGRWWRLRLPVVQYVYFEREGEGT